MNCILCGKPRLIERNPGQFNDGDDFCSDECYNKFGQEVKPMLNKFISDLTPNQKQAMEQMMHHNHYLILSNMLIEWLECEVLF